MTSVKPGDEFDFGDVSWVVLRVYPAEVKIGIYAGSHLIRKTTLRMSEIQRFIAEGRAANDSTEEALPREAAGPLPL